MLKKVKSFTLVELIIVVIIVGILASLGLTQYSQIVEKSRLAEAKVRIGVMRNLAYEYYLNGGDMSTMTNVDVGEGGSCTTANFYRYWISSWNSTEVNLVADRCTSGGKAPDTSRRYLFFLEFYPSTGSSRWHCYYTDNTSPCFGFPT
jgi:prepilin-type N-terminal cleavage/methylation domain-containing protein